MTKADYYNQKNESYRVSGGRMQAILGLLPENSRKKALDIGCGQGQLAQQLKELGYSVTGVDISPDALSAAGPALDDRYCFDIETQQWPEALTGQKFDVIVASEVIEHVFFPEYLLEHLKKVLASGGRIIITTPNVLFWKNRMKMLFGTFRYEETGIMDFGHVRLLTIATARELFDKVGLRVEKENHFFPNLYKRRLSALGRALPGLFAYHMAFSLSTEHA